MGDRACIKSTAALLLGEDFVRVAGKLQTLHKKYPDGTPIGVDDNAVCILTAAPAPSAP